MKRKILEIGKSKIAALTVLILTIICSVIAGALIWFDNGYAEAAGAENGTVASGGGASSSRALNEISVPKLVVSSTKYSPNAQTLKLFDNVEGFKVSLPVGWTRNGAFVTLPAAASGGNYQIVVTPEDGYCWQGTDDTSGKILYFSVTTKTTADEFYDLETPDGKINPESLMLLMGRIMGKTTMVSYYELDTYLTQLGTHRTAMDIGAEVVLGGMRWRVVLSSETDKHEVYATLWLANSKDTGIWGAWSNPDTTLPTPSNMYSASYIRAYLNNTRFSTSQTEFADNVQKAEWKNFLDKYGAFISAPEEISYQRNLTGYANEGYGSGDVYSGKSGYDDWKQDKLWLPAYSEVGTVNTNGYWGVDRSVCFNGSYWLRSGRADDASYAYYTVNDSPYGNVANSRYGVRPALHLNLKQLAQSAGMFIDTPTIANDVTLTNTINYSTAAQTFTLSYHENLVIELTDAMLSNGWTVTNNIINVPECARVGHYTVKVSPDVGYNWIDGGREARTLNVRIDKAVVAKPVVTNSPFTYDGMPHTVELSGFDSATMTVLYNTDTRTNAGNYEIIISLVDSFNYKWADVADENVTEISLPWVIDKKDINISFSYGAISYGKLSPLPVMTGNEGGGAAVWSITSGGTLATINSSTGIITPISAGDITVRLTISETANYNGKFVELTVTIGRVEIAPPAIGDDIGYNGAQQTVSITNFNPDIMELVHGGGYTYSATAVGTYRVCVRLTDRNYMWSDTKGTENRELTWRIIANKVEVHAPTLLTENIFYSASSQVISLSSLAGWKIVSLPEGWQHIPNSTSIRIPAGAAARDDYFISVQLLAGYTCLETDFEGKIGVLIQKAEIKPDFFYSSVVFGASSSVPDIINLPVDWANGGKTWTITNEGITDKEKGVAKIESNGVIVPSRSGWVIVTLHLTNTENYQVFTLSKEIEIEKATVVRPQIKKGAIVYNANVQTVQLDGFVAKDMTVVGGDKATNAGSYQIEIKLNDAVNHRWDDNSTDNLKLIWTIEKAEPKIAVRINEGVYYLGDKLSTVTFTGEAKSLSGRPITGTFVWEDGDLELDSAAKEYVWTFTPDRASSQNYRSATGTVEVNAVEAFDELVWSGDVKTHYTAFDVFSSANLVVTAVIKGVSVRIWDYTFIYPYSDSDPNHDSFRVSDNGGKVIVTYTYANGTQSRTLTTEITVTVEKANYDLSGAYLAHDGNKYEGAFVYDKDVEYTLTLEGLPEGVSAKTYSDTTVFAATAVGNYRVEVLTFNFDEANYNVPEILTLTWRIAAQAPNPDFDFGTIIFGQNSTATSIDAGNSDGDYTISWAVRQGPDGGKASIDNNGVLTPVQAGTIYIVMFVSETENFASGSVEKEFTIEKATIDMSGTGWINDRTFTYNGSEFGVYLENLPEQVKRVIYENANGTNADNYTAKVVGFELFDDINYKLPEFTVTCDWTIEKADIAEAEVTVFDEDAVYTGAEITPDYLINFLGLTKEECTVSYNNNIKAGDNSELIITVKSTSQNYSGVKTVNFNIAKANYSGLDKVVWVKDSTAYIFDGSSKTVSVQGLPEGVSVAEYENGAGVNAGEYTASVKSFIYDYENYNEPVLTGDNATFTWKIDKLIVDSSEVRWDFQDGKQLASGEKPSLKAFIYVDGTRHEFDLKYNKSGSGSDWSAGIYEVTLDLNDTDANNFEFRGKVSRKIQLVDTGVSEAVFGIDWRWLGPILGLAGIAIIVLIALVAAIAKRRDKIVVNDGDDFEGFYDSFGGSYDDDYVGNYGDSFADDTFDDDSSF